MVQNSKPRIGCAVAHTMIVSKSLICCLSRVSTGMELIGIFPQIGRFFQTATSKQKIRGQTTGFRAESLGSQLTCRVNCCVYIWSLRQGLEFSNHQNIFRVWGFGACCNVLNLELCDLQLYLNLFSVKHHMPICERNRKFLHLFR